MNEQNTPNTGAKPKKKRSLWWLKLLLILILFAGGVIAGLMLSSQALTQQLIERVFPNYAYTETAPVEVMPEVSVSPVQPTEKAIEFKPVEPTPAPSKAPIEIISPEEKKTDTEEKDASPEEIKPEAIESKTEETPETSPVPSAVAAFAPVETQAPVEEPVRPVVKEAIGIDAALEAALKHAKLDVDEVTVYGVSREKDDDLVFYEVEFAFDGIEYEYEINAYTAVVEGWKTVRDKKLDDTSETTAKADANQYISLEEAKSIALKDADYIEAATTDISVVLEIDDGKVVYDVDFWAEGYDYEYRIDAESGNILHRDKELD